MEVRQDRGKVSITPDAFRALNEWTFRFGDALRDSAIEIARLESVNGVTGSSAVSLSTLRRALRQASLRTMEEILSGSSDEIISHENRSRVA